MSNNVNSIEPLFERGQAEIEPLTGKEGSLRRAFITAPSTVDTSVLRQLLHQRGLVCYELDEVNAEGRTFPELLEDCIGQADLVVAVVGGGPRESVFLQLGYALALKKRILALIPPGEETPIPLVAIPYLRARPDNREAIDFGLNRILAVPAGWQPVRNGSSGKTRPIGPLADRLLEKLARGEGQDGPALSAIVIEALTAAGISTMSRPDPVGDERGSAAFAVWADDFEPWLGNPLLIEVQAPCTTPEQCLPALEHVSHLLERAQATWGLLLCGDTGCSSGGRSPGHPRLFVVNMAEFLAVLREKSLGDWLSEMRRNRVHGRG